MNVAEADKRIVKVGRLADSQCPQRQLAGQQRQQAQADRNSAKQQPFPTWPMHARRPYAWRANRSTRIRDSPSHCLIEILFRITAHYRIGCDAVRGQWSLDCGKTLDSMDLIDTDRFPAACAYPGVANVVVSDPRGKTRAGTYQCLHFYERNGGTLLHLRWLNCWW